MRKEFIGHFKRPADEIDTIWKTATFVFDANVLLNLYRYSSETRNDFLNLFGRVKSQIWLPEQVAYEFLNNRPRVISEQSKAYAEAIKSVEALSKSFSEERAHPFISHKVKVAYDIAATAIRDEMNKNQAAQDNLLTEDTILDNISDLFEGKVGAAYAVKEMTDMFSEGEKRFAQNTPPGYKDGKKFKEPKNDAETRSNFGDWILWKQLMDFSKANDKPVILVTNDTKEDWWLVHSGKTLGPRPELIAEFFAATEQHILIYKPERFLDLGKQNLHATIDAKSIAEVSTERAARERSREHRKLLDKQFSRKLDYRPKLQLREKEKLEKLYGRSASDSESDWHIESMREEMHNLESHLDHLNEEQAHLQHLFSHAVDAGESNKASEIDEHLHETILSREAVREKLKLLRYDYEKAPEY